MSPVKKATKKVAKKKVTPKKPAKKVAKKKVATKKAVRTTKPAKTVKPRRKDTINDSFKKGEKKPFSFPQSVSLAVIAVPRLPVDIDALAIGMARYGGVAFVVVGACFTLLYANTIGLYGTSIPQISTVIDGTEPGTGPGADEFIGEDSTENEVPPPPNGNNQPPPPSLDPRPAVTFDVVGAVPLSDTATVIVSVPYAEKVKLFLFHKETGDYLSLGQATQVADETWEKDWHAGQFPGGEYRIKALVINEFGSYDSHDNSFTPVDHGEIDEEDVETEEEVTEELIEEEIEEETEEVENESTDVAEEDQAVDQESEENNESDVVEDVTTTDEPETIAEMTFTDLTEDLVGIAIEFSDKPDVVTLKAVHTEAGALYELGRAEHVRDGLFAFNWELEQYEPGTYSVFAHTRKENRNHVTRKFEYSFDRVDEVDDIVIDEVETDEALAEDKEEITVTEVVEEENSEDSEEVEFTDEVLEVTIVSEQPLLGLAVVEIIATNATFVELHTRKKSADRSRFLGLARKKSDDTWEYRWDTTNTPNGEYALFARAKQDGTLTEREALTVRVDNPQTTRAINDVVADEAPKRIAIAEEVAEAAPVVKEILEEIKEEVVGGEAESVNEVVSDKKFLAPSILKPERIARSQVISQDEVPPEITTDEATEDVVEEVLEDTLDEYQEELDEAMQGLAVALRSGDSTALEEAKRRVKTVESDIKDAANLDGESGLESIVSNRIARTVAERKLRTEESETVIKERVATEVFKDSDNDGITDFDEVNLYDTDPLSADSDNDGFLDGVEIISGYNPTDASPEATVVFESPKEAGVVREDLLVVEAITTLTPDPEVPREDGVKPEALISGKALPNSFVTLYIFSNPVVVTVKTDAEGNWNYRFDKELEDGEHEVYVGVTDNAGRVVAKSAPVTFVKTAEAFTPVDASSATIASQGDTGNGLISQNSVLLFASLSVVSIGLVLILLGLHLQNRREEDLLVAEAIHS